MLVCNYNNYLYFLNVELKVIWTKNKHLRSRLTINIFFQGFNTAVSLIKEKFNAVIKSIEWEILQFIVGT